MKPQLHLVFCALVISSVMFLVLPASAHHGFQYEYDGTKYVDITGVLTKVDWENPHIYFDVDVKDATGKVTSYRFEGSSVTLVRRTGVNRSDLVDNVGKKVTVHGCPSLDGSPKVAAETVKLPDGREIVVARKRGYGDGGGGDNN